MRSPLGVRWSRAALDEYEASVAYLRAHDAKAAVRYVEALDRAVASLARHPGIGRKGRVEGTLEKSLPRWRHVIAYRSAGEETLETLHVVHTSRHWPKGQWPKE